MAKGDKITSGNFTFTETSIEGVKIVDIKTYGDERGCFMETYKRPEFTVGGIECEFVQDNQSLSGTVKILSQIDRGGLGPALL